MVTPWWIFILELFERVCWAAVWRQREASLFFAHFGSCVVLSYLLRRSPKYSFIADLSQPPMSMVVCSPSSCLNFMTGGDPRTWETLRFEYCLESESMKSRTWGNRPSFQLHITSSALLNIVTASGSSAASLRQHDIHADLSSFERLNSFISWQTEQARVFELNPSFASHSDCFSLGVLSSSFSAAHSAV